MTQTNYNNEYTGSKSGEMIQDLIEENKFLLKLVDTIPAKIYFDHDIQEKITSDKHEKMDKNAEGLKKRFYCQVEFSAKNKHKRAKLDPHCQKSVSQIHQELGNDKPRKNKKNGLLLSSASLTRAANIEELQKRLQGRINELQLKRKGCGKSDSKKKSQNKDKKLKKKKTSLIKVNEVNMQANKALPKPKEKTEPAPKYNKDGKIIYSKLDFSEEGTADQKPKSEFTGKDYKTLLKKAEKKKEKLENLKSVNPEKALTVAEKEKWKKAILLSENVKVKDDPELLKKSLKKQEKMKAKKAKAWKERIDHTEDKQKARQEKRTKNIQKRRDEKLKSKIKHAKKRGRIFTST